MAGNESKVLAASHRQAQKLPYQEGWPGERIAVDLFGPLPVTRRGFSPTLPIVDHFSKSANVTAVTCRAISHPASGNRAPNGATWR